jgi:hypothetical protein
MSIANAGSSSHPHFVSYGAGHMIVSWATGASMTAQVYDSSTGDAVGSSFTVDAADHPCRSSKPFPDGTATYAGVASASSTIQIARVLPCTN